MPNTKNVLDWFYTLNKSITVSLFDNMWKYIIPDQKERDVIISVLLNHYLLSKTSDILEITPKGKEYKEWREKI